MTGPVITTTFREQGASELSNSFDKVGQSSEKMGEQVGSASQEFEKTGQGFDRMEEGADVGERRFTGFYDTIGGTKDALAAFGDESLSTSDKMIALGQAGADLAGGFADFLIPVVRSLWTRLMATTAATWALNTAQRVWAATTKGSAAAMAFLNMVMRANPILLIVSLIAILVTAFLALWTRSEGFRNFFMGMWRGIQTIVGNVVRWIVDRFNGLMNFFRNFPQRIGAALGSLGSIIGNIFKGAVNILIDALNWGIDRVNDLIYGANLINPFEDIPAIPKIRRLHTGGVVPGMPGQEVLTILQGGEEVSPSGQGSSGGTLKVAPGADKAVAELINYLVRKKYIRLV